MHLVVNQQIKIDFFYFLIARQKRLFIIKYYMCTCMYLLKMLYF